MNKLKLEAIITSIVIYLILIVAIFFGAIYEPSTPKAKIYVSKKSDIIEVSLGGPSKSKIKTQKKTKRQKNRIKPKKKPKKIRNVKKITKTKKRVVKKHFIKTHQKVAKKSVPNASSLFKNLPNSIADDAPINSSKPKGKSGKSIKKVDKGKGIVNPYFAKVQHILEGWPAQNNFAGEKVSVELTVYSSGLFDYKILSHSLNPEFNRALTNYLNQLKKFGFGIHSNPKPYKIIVEFIAKG